MGARKLNRSKRQNMHITHVFKKNFLSTKRIVINRGGTRSSKTVSLCQVLVNWLFFGEVREGQFIMEGRAAVVRKYRKTIKATVMRDFENELRKTGWYNYVHQIKSELSYTYMGRTVEFVGADDVEKLHGFKCNILYCNEAIELSYDKFKQLEFRCTDLIFLDFNPRDPYTWINTKIEQVRQHRKKDVDVIVSTYKDNPYLTQYQIDSIEYTRTEDESYWKVYGLGNYGDIMGLCFPDITVVDTMPQNLRNHGFGIDFGYMNDPTALIECGILNQRDVYFDEWFYMRGMKTNDIVMSMKVLNFDFRKRIWADSSEPLLIDELKDRRLRIQGAKKGPDSVRHGIQKMNQYKLHVTERSANVLMERTKYVWLTDKKTSKPLNKPIDAFNHTFDAMRYWAEDNLKIRRYGSRKMRTGTA